MLKATSKETLKKTVFILQKGGVVICPTDTVYGFLADAQNKKAVAKIYRIKKRPRSKTLPVFVASLKMAGELVEINQASADILKKHWPGKYTFVLKSKKGSGTVALRIPRHPFLQKLLKKINKPLAQTSVNISGKEPLIKIKDIAEQFGEKADFIVDGGNLPKSKPSKIIDLSQDSAKVIRK